MNLPADHDILLHPTAVTKLLILIHERLLHAIAFAGPARCRRWSACTARALVGAARGANVAQFVFTVARELVVGVAGIAREAELGGARGRFGSGAAEGAQAEDGAEERAEGGDATDELKFGWLGLMD